MGRTNGKLTKFLKDGLQNRLYPNLNWEDEDLQIFSLKLPRYEKRKELDEYEKVLIHWYITNNRTYHGYSNAKAVIQAALKKSVYLVCLNSNSNELKFRFATKDEEQEKRRKQKSESTLTHKEPFQESSDLNLVFNMPEVPIQAALNLEPFSLFSLSSPPPSISPSLSTSSGYQSGSPPPSDYHSGNDDMEEDMNAFQETNLSDDSDILETLNDILENPHSFIKALDDMSKDIEMSITPNDTGGFVESSLQDNTEIIGVNTDPVPVQTLEKPVVELTATKVSSTQVLNTYWLCTSKLDLDSTLLCICEKQIILDESQGISPGEILLNNVLEPGVSYSFKKRVEFDGKCFLFLLRDN